MKKPDPQEIRHSKANEPDLEKDPDAKARREARNALEQFETVNAMVDSWLERSTARLRPSHLLSLQRMALDGLSEYAGTWRPADIKIGESDHQPPGAHLVPELVEDLCDYVNSNWEKLSAIDLAAYVMWRLNWIHPFTDGNGRTARAASYLVLCAKVGYRLPGTNTIPDQITGNRKPYYDALEAADLAHKEDLVDVSDLAKVLEGMLSSQLVSVFQDATGA